MGILCGFYMVFTKEYKYYSGRPVSPISTCSTLDINPNLAPLRDHISVNTPATDL